MRSNTLTRSLFLRIAPTILITICLIGLLAFKGATREINHVYDAQLISSANMLWLVVEDEVRAALLTCIARDRLNTLQVTHCAGRGVREWFHHLEAVKAWGRENGCKRVEVTCRPGWERFLGMKRTHVVLEEAL